MSNARLAVAAWESLMRTHAVLLRGFEEAGDFAPLTSREYDVLFNLSRAPGHALRMRELVSGALVSQPSMSRMVDRLATDGLVRRESDPADGRGVRVALTDAGLSLQREIGRRHVRSIDAAFAVLDDAELAALERLCTTINPITTNLRSIA